MCGRFTLEVDAATIERLFDVNDCPDAGPRFNIAPTQPVVGIRENREGDRETALFRWGLIPHWAKDMEIGARMINARSETVAEKPSFRTPFKRRRCLIPFSGFYEWRRSGKAKQPYYIHRTDETPFAVAGIWDVWQKGEEAYIESCSLLTTDANDTLRPIHHRMPVILRPDDWDRWLDVDQEDARALLLLLRPHEGDGFEAYPVSRHVNNPRNDDPTCRASAPEVGQQTLL